MTTPTTTPAPDILDEIWAAISADSVLRETLVRLLAKLETAVAVAVLAKMQAGVARLKEPE